MGDYKINPDSKEMKKLLTSYEERRDFSFILNNPSALDGSDNPVSVYVNHFVGRIVEEQEELIERLVTRVVNEEFTDISIDRNKLIEVFRKHTPKKVKRLRDGVYCHCGACDKALPVTAKYCPECGQKIDWDHEYYTEGKGE